MGRTCSSGFPTGEPGIENPPPVKQHTHALGTGTLGYSCPWKCGWQSDPVEGHAEGQALQGEHIKTCEWRNNPFRVQVGQVWKDNDMRSSNQDRIQRTVKVVSVHPDSKPPHAMVRGVKRDSLIRLDRFNENRQTGYTLISRGPG